MVPQLLCPPAQESSKPNFAAHQPLESVPINVEWHHGNDENGNDLFFEITTFLGNDRWKSRDAAANTADFQKKVIASLSA